jgi:hypothetical protein
MKRRLGAVAVDSAPWAAVQQQPSPECADGKDHRRGLNGSGGCYPRGGDGFSRAVQRARDHAVPDPGQAAHQAYRQRVGHQHRSRGAETRSRAVHELTHGAFAEAQVRRQLPARSALDDAAEQGHSLTFGKHRDMTQHLPCLEALLDDQLRRRPTRTALVKRLERWPAPAQLVHGRVVDDPVQPARHMADLGTSLQGRPCAQQSLLQDVLAVSGDQAAAVCQQRRAVTIGQNLKGQAVTLYGERQKTLVGLAAEEKLGR